MRTGQDALILTTGITLKIGLDAADLLSKKGLTASVLHVPTVKPLDIARILKEATLVPVVVTVEEHSAIGGLGSAVAEVVAEAGFDPAKRFKRIGLPDSFPDRYGSQQSLMERYEITPENVATTVIELESLRHETAQVFQSYN